MNQDTLIVYKNIKKPKNNRKLCCFIVFIYLKLNIFEVQVTDGKNLQFYCHIVTLCESDEDLISQPVWFSVFQVSRQMCLADDQMTNFGKTLNH